MLRLLVVTYLSLLSLGASGCQESATLLGAIVCQGICEPIVSDTSDQLSYRGLNARIPPRIRPGSFASATVGVNFLNPGHLGSHGYRYNWSEKNGIVYTCKAGHIDIAHVRKAADWTGFLSAKTLERLMKEETEFSFKLREPSLYYVRLSYPENWESLPQKEKERIAYVVSVKLGQYYAYIAATWHEILTWFGYAPKGFLSEFDSAFSWEDMFSNILGTYIAVLALQDTKYAFSEAVTFALDQELEKLGVQPKQTARRAANKVKGEWFSCHSLFFVDMKRRNFDIGLDDGYVTPLTVPSASECEGIVAKPYPVPNLDLLSKYGFSVKLEIEPREWEKDKILKVVYPGSKEIEKRLEPAIHFVRIMDYIKEDAAKRYGRDVNDDS